MNNEKRPAEWSANDSLDCLIIFDDGPGDTTVRPCPPELLASSMAEREKILRWQKPREKPQPPNGPASPNPQ
jgi:hypothetical protein